MRILGVVVTRPELGYTTDAESVLSFRLEGIDRTQKNSDANFSEDSASWRVVCRESLADSLADTVQEGTFLQVDGKMTSWEYTDDETGSYFFADAFVALKAKILGEKSRPYTYVEATSSLYGPDGSLLKQMYCPKAVSWNQLVADDPEDRSRGCRHCAERVMNLDTVPVVKVLTALKKNPSQCLFGSEKSIRYLRDPERPKHPRVLDGATPVRIYTVRSIEDINRGVADGFWPDVRLVTYNTKELKSKFAISQNRVTGAIDVGWDLRDGAMSGEDWREVVDFTYYYPYYQKAPLAAYLVPKGLPSGSPVIVLDPIEDILGYSFGQGDTARASNVNGVWDGERIVLNVAELKVSYSLG